MDVKNLLKKYYFKLTAEGIIKSVVFGAIFGFIALVGYEFYVWLNGLKAVWLGLVFFAVFTAAFGVLSYFKKFRPTMRAVADRIDKLGLEERILTMTEFKDETSEIYAIQRADALNALAANGITEKLIKIVLSAPLIIALSLSAAFGIGMTTVSALSANGVISDGSHVIEDVKPKPQYEIYYEVAKGEGYIDGEIFQVVEQGQNASAVLAVAEDGYAFSQWSDNVRDPYRLDADVRAGATYYAIFLPVSETGMVVEDGEDGDFPAELPADFKQGNNGKKDPEDGDPGMNAGGKYEEANQVFDGETYYGGQVYRNAYEEVIERLAKEQGWTEEEKKMINDYFKTIAK